MSRTLRRILIAVVVVVVLLAGAVTLVLANSPLNRTYADVPDYTIDVPIDDPEAIERGEYLVRALTVCTICHGPDLGGTLAFNDDFLGSVHTPNLTTGEGGVGAYYTTEDWVNAIRYGVSPEHRGLIFMPSDSYNHLTDEDLGAMIAYLQSVEPVDRTDASRNLTVPAQVLLTIGASGQVARTEFIDFAAERPVDPASDLEYGRYLVAISGCSFCHGDDLRGGQGLEPGAPPGPNLRVGGPLDDYNFDQFSTALRQGLMPNGEVVDPVYMPWPGYAFLTDEDVEVIWEYLRSE